MRFSSTFRISAAAPLLLGAALCVSAVPSRGESLRGPVEAQVLDVLDGDTFIARAKVWPGHAVTVRVRIRGIDAPEMRARCEAERIAAWRAKEMLAGLVAEGPVAILNIGGGKYYGRVLADVAGANGEDVASVLLRSGHVRRYDGGRREGWCP